LGFLIDCHKTIGKHNFDFTYSENGMLKAVEEVLGFKKKKALIFFEILVLHEKHKKLIEQFNVPFFVSTIFEVQLKEKIERFPLELLIWAFEKGMIPILSDNEVFNSARRSILNGNSDCCAGLVNFLNRSLRERRIALRKCALAQSKQGFDKLEMETHEKLVQLGVNPEGKKMLETKYGTFIVTDDYFREGIKEFAVFASKNDIEGVVGSCALVKEMVFPSIKTIGLVTGNKRTMTGVRYDLIKTYVDYFINSTEKLEE
jgi:hypothetical protein